MLESEEINQVEKEQPAKKEKRKLNTNEISTIFKNTNDLDFIQRIRSQVDSGELVPLIELTEAGEKIVLTRKEAVKAFLQNKKFKEFR